MTPEGRVKKLVKAELSKLGDQCWRFMPVQTGFGVPSLDFMLCINGWFVAIETKAPGKKLTPLQEGTKAAMETAGGIVLVIWDEASLAIAMKIIKTLTRVNGNEHVKDCAKPWIDRSNNDIYSELADRIRDDLADRIREQAQDQGAGEQHLRQQQQGETPAEPVGGDHGTSRTPPQRRAKPGARRNHQSVTAAVTADETAPKYCTCGAYAAIPPHRRPHMSWCPRTGLDFP